MDLHELRDDIKEIKADVKLISATMSRNTSSLEIHEHRTTLAEKRLDRFERGAVWVLGLIGSGVLTIVGKLLLR